MQQPAWLQSLHVLGASAANSSSNSHSTVHPTLMLAQQHKAVIFCRCAWCCAGVLQVVVDRMFKRVLTFAGLPVTLGMVLFPVFWYLKVSSLLVVAA
jgi:hypothetical protein